MSASQTMNQHIPAATDRLFDESKQWLDECENQLRIVLADEALPVTDGKHEILDGILRIVLVEVWDFREAVRAINDMSDLLILQKFYILCHALIADEDSSATDGMAIDWVAVVPSRHSSESRARRVLHVELRQQLTAFFVEVDSIAACRIRTSFVKPLGFAQC